MDVDKPDEVGFGGWLIYVVVTLGLSLLNLIDSLWTAGGIYFDPERWSQLIDPNAPWLTDPSAPDYSPSLPTLIRYQVWGGSTLLLLDALVLGLMITRRRAFRIAAMVFYGAALPYLVGEYLLVGGVTDINNQFDAQTAKAIFFKLAATVFGLTYLANSHRVRNTFVK